MKTYIKVVIAILAIFIICGIFYYLSIKIISPDTDTTINSATSTDSSPLISSISPTSGPIGTIVELKGLYLGGFEGDLDAYIRNSSGEVGYLLGIGSVPRADQTIRVKIDSKLCKTNNSYVGECQSGYLTINPGVYKIYTEPWGKKSNEVTFTVL